MNLRLSCIHLARAGITGSYTPFLPCFFLLVLEIEPRASCMLASTQLTEPHSQFHPAELGFEVGTRGKGYAQQSPCTGQLAATHIEHREQVPYPSWRQSEWEGEGLSPPYLQSFAETHSGPEAPGPHSAWQGWT